MLLFDGPVDAVATIGPPTLNVEARAAQPVHRLSPQWWWPDDRAWFLATEIDDPWSYVAGPPSLLDAIVATGVDAAAVQRTQPW